jgi:hypothetical protein
MTMMIDNNNSPRHEMAFPGNALGICGRLLAGSGQEVADAFKLREQVNCHQW